MEIVNNKPFLDENIINVLKRGASGNPNKEELLDAIQESARILDGISPKETEEGWTPYLSESIKTVFIQIYRENANNINNDKIGNVKENLMISNVLINIIHLILEKIDLISVNQSMCLYKSVFVDVSDCLLLTFKHCKESQEKYQKLLNDCGELLEIYKNNVNCYTKLLDMLIETPPITEQEPSLLLIKSIKTILQIMRILFGMNTKLLTNSWMSYLKVINKHHDTLNREQVECAEELEMLIEQINFYLHVALENSNEKIRIQHMKLSGFLLKTGITVMNSFWGSSQTTHREAVFKFVCSVYDYSMEFMGKWDLKADFCRYFEEYLFEPLNLFVVEKLLCRQFLTYLSSCKMISNCNAGCLVFYKKLIEYLIGEDWESISYFHLDVVVNHVLEMVVSCDWQLFDCPTNSSHPLIESIIVAISDCVLKHNHFYDTSLERVLFKNVLGGELCQHVLASEIWLRILCFVSMTSRDETIMTLLRNISKIKISIYFNSVKVIFLKRFAKGLFNLLSETEKISFLSTLNSHDEKQLRLILGCKIIPSNFELSNSTIVTVNEWRKIGSAAEFSENISQLEMLSTSTIGIHKLLEIIKDLWEFRYEEIDTSNNFLKYFVSKLVQATVNLITHFSNDIITCILSRMKVLANEQYLKLQLCYVLNAIAVKNVAHSCIQSKSDFLISDLFEILLTEENVVIRGVSLEVLQAFHEADRRIIVNNVLRILPNMNLESYLQGNTEVISSRDLSSVKRKEFAHKCLDITYQAPKTIKYKPVQKKENEQARIGVHCNAPIKRIKLAEDVPEDDTVSEVLERMKNDLNCLKKVLRNEKLTPKSSRDLKMLICQLENILS